MPLSVTMQLIIKIYFFVCIHFCANFPTTNGKKIQKLRLLSNLSDHTQRFKEENGNTISLHVYNAAHKPICNLQRHMKCLYGNAAPNVTPLRATSTSLSKKENMNYPTEDQLFPPRNNTRATP